MATRRANDQHRRSHEDARTIPLLVADYCFLKTSGEEKLQPVLVMRLYPYMIFFACVVEHKGSDPLVIRRVAKFLHAVGLYHFAYRCDRGLSINSMIESACLEAGRRGFRVKTDDPDAGVPEPEDVDDEPSLHSEDAKPDASAPSPLIAVLSSRIQGKALPMVLPRRQ